MLKTRMLITKDVNKKFKKEYFFVRGFVEIDSNYFIKEIQKTCNSNVNLNFKTNIKGLMTNFKHFSKDEIFLKIIDPFIDFVDENYDFPEYRCTDAWGFEVRPGEKTSFHSHSDACWAGVIYLNSCNQPLLFPEIKEEVKPEKGSFAIFSSFLEHGCDKNKDNVPKFGLSFNMCEVRKW